MKRARKIAKYKIYLDRSRTYVGYIQLMLIIKLVLSDVGISSNIWLIGSLVTCVLLLGIIGYLDTKLGIRRREIENHSWNNPVLMEILDKLKKLENK